MQFSKKPAQLVRHMHEVLLGYKKAVAAGETFMVQLKEDGVFGFAIHTGAAWEVCGRTGKKFTNVESIEAAFEGYDRGRVYVFEITCPVLSLEELSGIINPNRTKPVEHLPELLVRLHDSVRWHDFLAGYSDQPASKRYEETMLAYLDAPAQKIVSVIPSRSGVDEERIRLIAEGVIEQGHEGVVVKAEGADWKAGRKNHLSMKIVRGCDYDLQCIRVEEGLGKRAGMVANAICLWRRFGEPTGEVMHIPVDLGKGFTDERRIALWEDQSQIVGKVVEVHALQVGSQGSLRLPKVNSIRVDKEVADIG